MGSAHKIKVGINGFGRMGRFGATMNPCRAFGVKSSEESGVINGRDSSITHFKVINGKTSLQSVAWTWKAVHGVSMKGHGSGQVASFCSVPDNNEIPKGVKDLQPALDCEKIKNTTNLSMVDLNTRQKKSTMPLFPFSGADLLYLRDGAGLYNNLFAEGVRLNYIEKVRKKCWNLMGKSEKTMELVEKCLARDGPEGLATEIEKVVQLVLRSKSVPYGCNTYLNEVKKMRTLVSKRTGTRTTVETVKLRTIYQGASMIAQDICAQLKNKMQFRLIFGNIIKEIPMEMKNGVEGIRVAISGRINGAEIARTECGKYGKTSRTTFSQHVDYARAEAITRSGLIGVKVWISYRKNRKAQSSPSVQV